MAQFRNLGRLAFAAVLALLGTFSPAAAQDYPNRPVRVICGYPAGGGGDVLVRYYAAQLEKLTGQRFVVENRVGANGKIGTDALRTSKPDGYTLLLHGTAAVVGNTFLMKDAGYDPLKDLQAVATLTEAAFVLTVNPESGINTVQDLIDKLKAANGAMKYGTATGVTLVASEKFLLETGTKATRVNYKGTVDAARELTAKQIDFLIADATFSVAQAKQGRLKLLGMTTKQRLPTAPDIPTMAEAGVKDYVFTPKWVSWFPKDTPKEIVEKMAAWLRQIAASEETKAFLLANSATPLLTNSVAEAEATVKGDIELWRKVTTEARITPAGS
jgi:tripartite-type tricarboxylate transporter receptor subunit TctC